MPVFRLCFGEANVDLTDEREALKEIKETAARLGDYENGTDE